MNREAIAPLRLIAWETTRACNLLCRHCRAEAILSAPPDELSHSEGINLLKSAAGWFPAPMIILSGGEPLMRDDIFELAAYGTSLGMRMLLSTNGTLIEKKTAAAIKNSGIARVSLSLDGPDASSHDEFRGCKGAYDGLVRGAAYLREAQIPFQINTTLTSGNLHQAEAMSQAAEQIGAVAHHIFLLVPVGRAEDMDNQTLNADEYEKVLKNLRSREDFLKIEFKATCAPQYQRIGRQLGLKPKGRHGSGRGCMAGQGFMFVSSTGICQGCGYLPLAAGSVREDDLRFIYESSNLFMTLRDKKSYGGSCGSCEYWSVCGGCRARAHARGDYLGQEPLCPHQPSNKMAS